MVLRLMTRIVAQSTGKKKNFSFLRLGRLYEEHMRKDNRSSVSGMLFIQEEKSGRLSASEIKRRCPDWRGEF